MAAHAIKSPSFFSSVVSGISGSFKGFLAGGAVGAIAGAVIGLSIAIATGGLATAAIVGAVGAGAAYGAATFAPIGALAGTVTGVVRSREKGHTAENTAAVANISFSQGIEAGRQMQYAQDHGTVSFREREEQRRAAQTLTHQHR